MASLSYESWYTPAFKVRVFTNDWISWSRSKCILVVYTNNSNFDHSFDFHCLKLICDKYQFAWFLFDVRFTPWRVINSWQYNMMSKIWIRMSTTNIYSLQFKIQSHLQKMWTLNISTSELIPKKQHQFLTRHSAFLHFFHQKASTKLPSWSRPYFGIYFPWWNRQIQFKMVYKVKKKRQNLVFLNLKCVTYT